MLDGELVVNDATGRPSFSALQARATLTSHRDIDPGLLAGDPARLRRARCEDYDLRESTLEERKRILERVLPTAGRVPLSRRIPENRVATSRRAAPRLEGVVGKRAASRYKRALDDWIRCVREGQGTSSSSAGSLRNRTATTSAR